MKIKFREPKLSKSNRERLLTVNGIITEYQAQGYVLTLRQLYYQLVSRDVIPNKLAEYAKLSILLKEGRMGGIVDWDAIEDRLRKPYTPGSWDSPKDILNACVNGYELPRMDNQETYVEVWVEKDALSGVLKRITSKYHIPILVNRGYSSASAMYDSFQRFKRAYNRDQNIVVLYLGDYDPSGIDMIRDIKDRTLEFANGYFDSDEYDQFDFEVRPIALTREQIRYYDPPENPAKRSDPRAAKFIESKGSSSWEVDALKPEVLNQILEDSILDYIDEERYLEIVSREEADKNKLRNLTQYL